MLNFNLKNKNFLENKYPQIIEFLNNNDVLNLEYGRYELNDDDFLVRTGYEMRVESERVIEAHKQYDDVHFIIQGSEMIGVEPVGNLKIVREYNDVNDDYLLTGTISNNLLLNSGDFLALNPNDAHMTAIDYEEAKCEKIIFKIKRKKH